MTYVVNRSGSFLLVVLFLVCARCTPLRNTASAKQPTSRLASRSPGRNGTARFTPAVRKKAVSSAVGKVGVVEGSGARLKPSVKRQLKANRTDVVHKGNPKKVKIR